jgi:hypothetical protein
MMRVFGFAVVVAIGLTGHLALAQETTGDIRGRVLADSVARPNVTVVATGRNLLGERRAVTAHDGVFQVRALPPGLYTLQIVSVGFSPVILDSVRVQLGRTAALGDIALKRASAELSEVRITAPPVTLDAARTTVGATLESSDLANFSFDRDYKSVISTLPHVNTSYHGDPANAAGSTGLENMYFVDGANVTTPRKASGGTRIPYNFIRSVEVRSGGYEAQYGKALGSIVNAVTYSGTNTFETNVFGFGTHDALAADPRATPSLRETGSVSYDVGVRVSGPVVRDRLWFSAAYNPQVERADRVVGTFGTYTDLLRANIFAGKLTWQSSPDLTTELSVLADPTTHDQVAPNWMAPNYAPLNPETFRRRFESGGTSVSLRSRWSATPTFAVTAQLARSNSADRDSVYAPSGSRTLLIDDVNRTVEGGVGLTSIGEQGVTSATLHAALEAGRHTLQAGVEYEESRVARQLGSGNGLLYRWGVNEFVLDSHATDGVFLGRVPTAFLQESWRASDRLTVNAGLRWSTQLLDGESGRTAQRLANQWQPRLGFSWQLDDRMTRRLFASYGRFYQQVPLSISTLLFVDYRQSYTFYSNDPRLPGAVPDSALDLSISESTFAGTAVGAQAENHDEFTLGFEQVLGSNRLTVRALRRELRSAFAFGLDYTRPPPLGGFQVGTPGIGTMSFLPPVRREHTALEASVDGTRGPIRYRTSYVLSRTWGNLTGVYSSDLPGVAEVGANLGLFMPHQRLNSTGLLPNDRTHVFKLLATYGSEQRLSGSAFFTWQSGTPLSEFGASPVGTFPPAFVAQRGSAGRTPAVWDLNLRLTYQLSRDSNTARFVLDLMHLGNPRGVVRVDQQHYQALDSEGRQATPNPDYRRPTLFQPPMMARVGVEITR